MQFRDTIDRSTITRPVPGDLITIDGVDIYDVLPGYTQIKTEGRDLVPLNVSTSSIDGQDGLSGEDPTFGSIQFTITYKLVSDGDVAQRKDVKKLNALLTNNRYVQVEFADDDGYYYPRCYLSNSTLIGDQIGDIILGTFTFTSLDSHAVKRLYSPGPITLEYANKVRPRGIQFVPDGSPTSLTFKNTNNEAITFNNLNIPVGHGVEILWTRERIRASVFNVSGAVVSESILGNLAQYSALYNFYLYDGDNVSVTGATGNLVVGWEDISL